MTMERQRITDDLVRRLLIGVSPGEWRDVASSDHVVAPSGIVARDVRGPEDRALIARCPEVAEWALDQHERARRAEFALEAARAANVELRKALDEATATPEFGDEMAEASDR
jgi:hypothetical protein